MINNDDLVGPPDDGIYAASPSLRRRTAIGSILGAGIVAGWTSSHGSAALASSAETLERHGDKQYTFGGIKDAIGAGLSLDGHTPDGKVVKGTDDGPFINNVLAGNTSLLIFPASPHIIDPKQRFYALIDTPVFVPSGKSLKGVDSRSGFIAGQTTNRRLSVSALFFLNVDVQRLDWVEEFPNTLSTKIEGLRFSAYLTALAGSNTTIFIYSGSITIENCKFIGVTQVAKSIDRYSDAPVFRRITVLEAHDGGADHWLLNHAEGQGDGGLIEQCLFLGMSDPKAGGATTRAKAIRLHNRSSWSIRQILNGDIYISNCRATEVSGLYMERGQTRIESSRGTRLRDSVYFQRESGTQAITPLILGMAEDRGVNSVETNLAVLENIGFIYDPLGQQVPWTAARRPGNFDRQNRPNFIITGPSNVLVRNLYREFNPGDYERSVVSGASSNHTTFNDYSHICSRDSTFSNGAWTFKAVLPGLRRRTMTLSYRKESFLSFNAAGGTYYYDAIFLYDVHRRVGMALEEQGGSFTSVSQEASFGRGGAVEIEISCDSPCVVRIYRGMTAGLYSSYVDVPIFGSISLFDLGLTLNERPWVSRALSDVDVVTPVDCSFSINPARLDSGIAPYGQVSCQTSYRNLPSSGLWRAGDVIIFDRPVATVLGDSSKASHLGYRRLIDGSGHVLGQDWGKVIELCLDM